jgi:hypothetical protein
MNRFPRPLRPLFAAVVLAGVSALTSISCSTAECSGTESECDGAIAKNCQNHDGESSWYAQTCASAAQCQVVHGTPKCFLDAVRSPLCPVGVSSFSACENATTVIGCDDGWVFYRGACTRCHDKGECDGDRDSPCMTDADCLPELECFDNRPISMFCR